MPDDYSIHDIVTVRSDIPIPVPDYFRTSGVTDPDIVVSNEDLPEVPRDQKKQRAGYSVWAHDDGLVIDYEVFNLRFLVGGLEDQVKLRFTDQFVGRRPEYVEVLTKLAVQLKLIDAGHSFVHAGCVAIDDGAVVIPALGSTGKTYTTLSLVDGHGSFFMSDDLAIVGRDGHVYGYPGSVTTGPYVLENDDVPEFSVAPRLSSRLASVPFVSLLFEMYPWLVSSESIHPPESVIQDRAPIEAACLITGGTADDASRISPEEAARRALIQHFDTHSLFQNYGLNYYCYFFDYDLPGKFEEMRDIIEAAFDSARCYELRSNELSRYPELIDEVASTD